MTRHVTGDILIVKLKGADLPLKTETIESIATTLMAVGPVGLPLDLGCSSVLMVL